MNSAVELRVETERRLPIGNARILHFAILETLEYVLLDEACYRLDMCLTPRPADVRARYRDHWAADRVEPIGTVYLLPPGQALEVRSAPGASTSVICEIRADRVAEWLQEDLTWTDRARQASLGVRNPDIQMLLRRLADELRSPGLAHETMVELATAQIALELTRFCARVGKTPAAGGLTPRRLHIIDDRLAQGGAAPSLGELAALCNTSVRQLMRAFRASRGCTIGDYIAQNRVELAKRRLEGEESVKSIARALGFGSPSSFAYAFRRVTGMTPRQYRSELTGY
jgi:AraC family transcriptional regulator